MALRDCKIYNSRYGISLYYTSDSLVERNSCYNNVRGISLQSVCNNNIIEANRVIDNTSSAILINYGCSGNIVSRNYLSSKVVTGQAFLHTSIYCKNNLFLLVLR